MTLSPCEVAWFSALCDDDYEFLGAPDPRLESSFDHCRNIALTAEAGGFDNLLLPSGYALGIDSTAFAAAIAPMLKRMRLLLAVRCGETWPPQLARQIATLDQMMGGRLTVNIISSDFPGETADSAFRYRRSHEVVQILRQAWTRDEIDHQGEVYQFSKVSADPAKPYQQNGGPLLYFGGYSPDALELCGAQCDVYLMWPETKDELAGRMKAVHDRAAAHGRTLDYGLRVHMIVRDTEAEAREYARDLVSRLDDEKGKEIRQRALDATSLGVAHQARNRDLADDEGYVEPRLWTGIGRARSGCGAALVGSADQVLSEIEAYRKMGIRAFIFSGYPHIDECEHFGRLVMPHLKTCSLPHEYGRVPAQTPATPLGTGVRR